MFYFNKPYNHNFSMKKTRKKKLRFAAFFYYFIVYLNNFKILSYKNYSKREI